MNKKVLNRLVEIAEGIELDKNINPRTRHYAFVLNKNKIVSIACNSLKTHPNLLKYGYHENAKIHAEMGAIIKSGTFLHRGNKLITFRFDKSGNLNQGKPCPSCQRLLKDVGMREVWYSTANGQINKL